MMIMMVVVEMIAWPTPSRLILLLATLFLRHRDNCIGVFGNATSTQIYSAVLVHFPRAGAFRPCIGDSDCSVKEICNRQYMQLLDPPCSRGFCQCEQGHAYEHLGYSNVCKNVCSTYKIGDSCGVYPTCLFPEGSFCLNNTVTCKPEKYCPSAEGTVRTRDFGQECSSASDCKHFSLSCLPEMTPNNRHTRLNKKVCRCESIDYIYDRRTGKCRRYSYNDPCTNYCGGHTSVYKTGLICSGYRQCSCAVNHGPPVEITVPAIRNAASPSEAFLEITDTITICPPGGAIHNLKPGSVCDVRSMKGVCSKGSLCLACLNGCPQPICRALRLDPLYYLLSDGITPVIPDDPNCPMFGGIIGEMSNSANGLSTSCCLVNRLLCFVWMILFAAHFFHFTSQSSSSSSSSYYRRKHYSSVQEK